MRLISIDGGGILGSGVTHYLEQWERLSGRPAYELANAYAGTSTGSIIAAGLACGISATELTELYLKDGKKIFKKRNIFARINSHTYSSDGLIEILKDVFGETRMGEVESPLLITAADFYGGDLDGVTDFYTPESHPDMLIREAVLRSCSAPTYFPPVASRYADGGLFANNPSMALITYLQGLGKPIEKMRLLSFATAGRYWKPRKLSSSTLQSAKPLLEYLLSASTARVIHRYCKGIGLGWYKRIAPTATSPEMDAVEKQRDWMQIWFEEWQKEGKKTIEEYRK